MPGEVYLRKRSEKPLRRDAHDRGGCQYLGAILEEELGIPLVTNDTQLVKLFPDIARSPGQFLEN